MPVKLDFDNKSQQGGGPIIKTQIQTMIKRYGDKTLTCDTVSAWVSVSEVLQLIADNNASGIRIYYGRHAEDDHPDFANRHNVILVATRDSVNPEKPTVKNSDDLLNDEPLKGSINSVSGTFANVGDDTIPLCRPNCGGRILAP